MTMKTKKRKRSSRMHGRGMGTHGRGSRKKAKKSGHHGGPGMAGSGKRADHKKSLVINLYGNSYFGKQGITSRGTKRDTRQRISLRNVELNLESYVKKGIAKKSGEKYEVDLRKYKILGSSKDYKPKKKMVIKAMEASESAMELVKSAGGEIVLK